MLVKRLLTLMLFIITPSFSQTSSQYIYQQNYHKAQNICQQMTLDEKIGQLLLPSYTLLANSMSANGELCKKALVNPATANSALIHYCGLDQIKQYHLGAVLMGGGVYFNAPTLTNWANLNKLATQQHKLGNPLDPILLIGNDAVHGNIHLQGAVIFPHNIGLGVTHDPLLIKQIAQLVGQDSLASGFNWVYAPTIAVAQDLRWGRTYESFGQQPRYVKKMASAFVSGMQNIQQNKLRGPLATAKHFIGDGATQYGLDQGNDAYQGDNVSFWKKNGQGYEGALQAGVGSIMVSYSAIDGNDTRMHFGGKWYDDIGGIINQFKNKDIIGSDGQKYRLYGFATSDWNGPTRAAYFYNQLHHTKLTLPQIMAKSINGGVDMVMLGPGDTSDPFDANSALNFTNLGQVFNAIKTAYRQGLISQQRLNDAVTCILAVKLAMLPKTSSNYSDLQTKERALALQAAQESLVLLKNQDRQGKRILPLNRAEVRNVVFIGDTNDLGLQNGGWTITWQGQKGNQYFTGADKISSGATTLEEGVQQVLTGKNVHYFHVNAQQNDSVTNLSYKNTIAIALVSESPYAEFMGDIGNAHEPDRLYNMGAANNYNPYSPLPQSQFLGLKFNPTEAAAIQTLRNHNVKVITVVYSGRPVVLSTGGTAAPLLNSDALVAAFLPGTLGGKAIAGTIFGDYRFRSAANHQSNTLSFPWPRDMNDVINHFQNGNLFPIGYGLRD